MRWHYSLLHYSKTLGSYLTGLFSQNLEILLVLPPKYIQTLAYPIATLVKATTIVRTTTWIWYLIDLVASTPVTLPS